jgi:hypothetical protein
MKARWFFSSLLAWAATAAAVTPAHEAAAQSAAPIPTPIVYRNTEYGFCFRLPADWKGYAIVAQKWRGTMLEGPNSGQQTESGPQLLIRNPKWTEANPYQDIPIMVFTPGQWKLVAAEQMGVSAAPVGPGELGENKDFVFALPPRWIGFTDAKGQDELLPLMNQNPLEAPCGHKSAAPARNVP